MVFVFCYFEGWLCDSLNIGPFHSVLLFLFPLYGQNTARQISLTFKRRTRPILKKMIFKEIHKTASVFFRFYLCIKALNVPVWKILQTAMEGFGFLIRR